AFCLANNLTTLVASKRLPEVLQDFADLIECAFVGTPTEQYSPSRSVYDLDSEPALAVNERKAVMLPRDVYEALRVCIASNPELRGNCTYRTVHTVADGASIVLNAEAQILQHIEHRGVRYCIHAYHSGDSHVLFRASPAEPTQGAGNNALSLGRIHMIFTHKRLQADGRYRHQVFVALRPFTALSDDDQQRDPYRRYSALRATLIYASPSPTLRVVPMHAVVAQFVACPYREPRAASVLSRRCMVAIPLDQVRAKQRHSVSRN
ncbi:hypothetical protein C8T65DRAFT_771456, partial [Cerioporus squamosus]